MIRAAIRADGAAERDEFFCRQHMVDRNPHQWNVRIPSRLHAAAEGRVGQAGGAQRAKADAPRRGVEVPGDDR